MRKSTFCGLVVCCGLGSLFCGAVLLFVSDDSYCSIPKSTRVDGDFGSIASAIRMYSVINGLPPSTGQGLEALAKEPVIGPKPKRWSRVMDRVPIDPWETPYRYTQLLPKTKEWRYEIRSAGEDRVFGSGDDIVDESEWGSEVIPPTEALSEPRPAY